MLKPTYTLSIMFLASLPVITACGGGGDDGNRQAPSTPALTLTAVSIKQFRFSWPDAADETEYRLHEDIDGSSGFTQIATLPANTTARFFQVFLPDRVNARYLLQACNASSCTDYRIAEVNTSLSEAVGYIKASNAGQGDRFGNSVAISADGNTLAVGAPDEDSNGSGVNSDTQLNDDAGNSGAVYVFVRTGDGESLSQQAYLKASNSGENDQFGVSVSLSNDGSTLLVGASGEASNATTVNGNQADDSIANAGAAYVFVRSGSSWSQQAYLKAPNPEADDLFGDPVAISGDGNFAAVSARTEDSSFAGARLPGDAAAQADNGAGASGAVYLFNRTGVNWALQSYIKAQDPEVFDVFGVSVSLNTAGDLLAVGIFGDDEPNAASINANTVANSGAVAIFSRNATTWSQEAFLKASTVGEGDRFGGHVSLSSSGSRLAVGARSEDSASVGVQGDNNASNAGAAYVFTRNAPGTWVQEAYVKAFNPEEGDLFGFRLAISGDGERLVVGALLEDSAAIGMGGNENDNTASGSGAAYMYQRNGGSWDQTAYVKAPNSNDEDQFGTTAALSDDGSVLVIGANLEDSSATGLNGSQTSNAAGDSGVVYMY